MSKRYVNREFLIFRCIPTPDNADNLVEIAAPTAVDWRLEVYILRSMNENRESRPKIGLLMRPAGRNWDKEENQTFEKAIIALADGRPVFNKELEALLWGKFDNPVAGIVGAHLLLIQAEHDRTTDLTPLNVVVSDLRRLLGTRHPDVEALSLRCPDATLSATTPFRTPPIFERSWRLILEASGKNSAHVPLALWNRIVAQAAMPPYLVWSTDAKTKKQVRSGPLDAARVAMPAPAPPVTDAMLESIPMFSPTSSATAGFVALTEGATRMLPKGAKIFRKVSQAGVERKPAAPAEPLVQARRFVESYQLPPSAIQALQEKIRK